MHGSREIVEWKNSSKEETEGTLIGSGLATQGQLRKLKAGESFIDSHGQRWWKYRNEWPISRGGGWTQLRKQKWLYYSNPMPVPEEEPQPQTTDAVLGGTMAQPRPYDAVLGKGKSEA